MSALPPTAAAAPARHPAPPAPPHHSAAEIADALRQPPPTREQTEVIEAPLAPLLVVAGAGSGKTETMSARVVYLVANEMVRAEEVLGLTFTRKAAAELGHRVRKRLRALRGAGLLTTAADPADGAAVLDVDRPTIATYNSFAGNIARDHALRVGADPDARLITEAAAWQLADDLVQGWAEELATDRSPGAVTEAVLSLSGALSEHLLDPVDARELLADLRADLVDKAAGPRAKGPLAPVAKVAATLGERIALLDVVEAYTRLKRERGLIDFGDQVALAARIAAEVPEVGHQLRAQYRVVLLDEYQDTSVAQLRLLSALFGAGHAVTAVGDPNQAIYGWRGASAASLATFPAMFRSADGPATRTLALSTSWRNDRAVLDAANTVSAPLREPGAVVDVPVLRARPGAGPGEVLGLYAPTQEEESRQVAAFVADRWTPESPRTAAVLCRKRSQFPDVVAALRDRGLPVRVLGLGGLLSTPEVVDLRAALEVAHDAGRGDAMMRLLTNLRLGIADLHALQDWARELARRASTAATDDAGRRLDPREESSIVEAVEQPPAAGWCSPRGHVFTDAAAARVGRLGDVLRQVRSLSYLSLPELVVATEQLLELDIEVATRAGAGGAGAARSALDAFVEVAAGFAADSDRPSLGAFLSWLDAAEERERGLDGGGTAEEEPDTAVVQVLTVHAAKGLEWDVVAVPGMVETQFPGYDCAPRDDGRVTAGAWLTAVGELPYPLRGDSESLPRLPLAGTATHRDVADALDTFRVDAGAHRVAEERRLAYVAVTRARSTLLLSGSWFRTGKTALPPSRFLTEPRDAGHVTALEDGFAPAPAAGTENPALAQALERSWPTDPLGSRRPAREAAAAAVLDAAGRLAAAAGHEDLPVLRRLATSEDDLVRGWARDAELLLAERDAAASPDATVHLTGHLSASAVVKLVSDPQTFARDRRRPVPAEPTVVSRRGTRFHEWVERFYGRAALLDVDDVPGSGDEGAGPLADGDLAALQRTFTASPWAARVPAAVEVDLETPVAGTMVRCRIDAVFADGGDVEVVDWKTGRPPRDAEDLESREMQLALYRLAWSRATGTPLERVGAAFYYVGADTTVRAGDLTEEEIVDRITAALAVPVG